MGSTCACACYGDGSNNGEPEINTQKRRGTTNMQIPSKSTTPKIIDSNIQSKNKRNTSNISQNKLQITSTSTSTNNISNVNAKTLSLLLKMDPVSSIEENIDTSGSDTETPNSTQEYSPNIIISQMNTKTNPLQVSEMMRKYDWRASETDESSYSETEIYDIEQRKQLTLTINKSKSKSNLLRVSSNNEWESEDMNDLEYDMKRELKHQMLISQSVYNSTSTNYKESNESTNNSDNMDEDDILDIPASLFRLKSADKWNNQHITVQKEQMKKQMVHLVLNHNTFSNDNI